MNVGRHLRGEDRHVGTARILKCVKSYRGDRCSIKVMADGTLRYHYELTMHLPGNYCEFSTLAEVGEPYQPKFRRLIAAHGLRITRGVSFEHPPYVADILGVL